MAVFYREEHGALIQTSSLFEALCLPDCPHLTVSFVGAGGKTSAMYRLADELAARGKRVAVTTSTHIFLPEDRRVVVTDSAAAAIPDIRAGEATVIGQADPGQPGAGWRKLKSLPLSELGKLSAAADVLIIEADGAKRLPLKVPKDGEPVILPETDVVISCAGLDSLGRTFGEACFRFETEGGWLKGKTAKASDLISPGDMAEILTDRRGSKKSVGSREYRILLNKADDHERRSQALAIIKEIHNMDEIRCAVSSFRVS